MAIAGFSIVLTESDIILQNLDADETCVQSR